MADDDVTVDDLRDQDILPDDVLDKHLGGGPDDAPDDDATEDPDPDADDPPEDDDDDTSDKDTDDDEDEDTDDDDDDADEDEDEDEELDEDEDEDAAGDEDDEDEGDDDEEGDDEEEDVLDDHVTAEDHERIQKDPSLKKVHAQMQRAFTEKTMKLSTLQAQVERRDARITAFQTAIRTDEGMAGFLTETLRTNPDIIGTAFQALVDSEHADPEAFLVEVGLESPDLLEAALTRVQELQGDDGELKAHKRDRARQTKEAALDARELRISQATFDREMDRVEGEAQKEATRLKIHPDDMTEVNGRIKARVRDRLNKKDGTIDLTKAEIRGIVMEAKEVVDKALSRARKRLEREGVVASKKKTKKRVAKGRRPKRDKKGGPPKKKARKKTDFKPPAVGDPLDAFVDHRMDAMP